MLDTLIDILKRNRRGTITIDRTIDDRILTLILETNGMRMRINSILTNNIMSDMLNKLSLNLTKDYLETYDLEKDNDKKDGKEDNNKEDEATTDNRAGDRYRDDNGGDGVLRFRYMVSPYL